MIIFYTSKVVLLLGLSQTQPNPIHYILQVLLKYYPGLEALILYRRITEVDITPHHSTTKKIRTTSTIFTPSILEMILIMVTSNYLTTWLLRCLIRSGYTQKQSKIDKMQTTAYQEVFLLI